MASVPPCFSYVIKHNSYLFLQQFIQFRGNASVIGCCTSALWYTHRNGFIFIITTFLSAVMKKVGLLRQILTERMNGLLRWSIHIFNDRPSKASLDAIRVCCSLATECKDRTRRFTIGLLVGLGGEAIWFQFHFRK